MLAHDRSHTWRLRVQRTTNDPYVCPFGHCYLESDPHGFHVWLRWYFPSIDSLVWLRSAQLLQRVLLHACMPDSCRLNLHNRWLRRLDGPITQQSFSIIDQRSQRYCPDGLFNYMPYVLLRCCLHQLQSVSRVQVFTTVKRRSSNGEPHELWKPQRMNWDLT